TLTRTRAVTRKSPRRKTTRSPRSRKETRSSTKRVQDPLMLPPRTDQSHTDLEMLVVHALRTDAPPLEADGGARVGELHDDRLAGREGSREPDGEELAVELDRLPAHVFDFDAGAHRLCFAMAARASASSAFFLSSCRSSPFFLPLASASSTLACPFL